QRFGLDKSPVEQYFLWAGNFVKGELGISFRHKIPVSEMISGRIGNTFFLAVCALILTYVLAIPLGIYSAQHPYGKVDYTLTGAAFVGLSMPSFFAGILLIYLFAFKVRWFPFSGTVTAGAGYEGIALWLDKLHHVVLPALTLAIINIASYMRCTQASVLEARQQDYVRTAFATGVPAPLGLRGTVLACSANRPAPLGHAVRPGSRPALFRGGDYGDDFQLARSGTAVVRGGGQPGLPDPDGDDDVDFRLRAGGQSGGGYPLRRGGS